MDAAAQRFEPWVKAVAGSGLELLSLMSQRAQAYLELPTSVGNCRSPQDLVDQQVRFWQTALRQYGESSQRAMNAWATSMSLLGGVLTPFTPAAQPERDYITFPESEQATGAAEPQQKKPDERQAA
ncbi:MAG TPA: hypothetical protein VE665_06300 [Hyphomicrobiaceae bacterium]|jgi:hypothetical protein|nr:hypothetical protein [Hyphomicrobiaceae bacterium]